MNKWKKEKVENGKQRRQQNHNITFQEYFKWTQGSQLAWEVQYKYFITVLFIEIQATRFN